MAALFGSFSSSLQAAWLPQYSVASVPRTVDTPSPAHEFELLDLRRFDNCLIATRGIKEVYHLAADMGGIG